MLILATTLPGAPTMRRAWSLPAANPPNASRVRSVHVHAAVPRSLELGRVSSSADAHALAHVVTGDDRRHTGLGLLIVLLLNTLPNIKACAVVLQALPRTVLDPFGALPARGLPSPVGSATRTYAAPPPGEYIMAQSCVAAQHTMASCSQPSASSTTTYIERTCPCLRGMCIAQWAATHTT